MPGIMRPSRRPRLPRRACCTMRSSARLSAARSMSIACGSACEKNCAPWLPPKTSRLNGSPACANRIGRLRRLDHCRPHGIARDFDLVRRSPTPRKSHCDEIDTRRKQLVGPAHHRIGVVNHRRNAKPCGCEHGRHGRITAKADDRRRLDSRHHVPRLTVSAQQRDRRHREPQAGSFPMAWRRRSHASCGPGNCAAYRLARSSVARCDLPAASGEFVRQRLRRKEVPAGPAGAKHHRAPGFHALPPSPRRTVLAQRKAIRCTRSGLRPPSCKRDARNPCRRPSKAATNRHRI